jgi:A/G-specific adenine glycosylase
VFAVLAGVGYFGRARNLLASARIIAADGFPTTSAGLGRLPGCGPYTGAAIAAIAFGERCLPVDTNISRVGARLFALGAPSPALADAVRLHLDPHVPAERPGDFAQSLMDLGAGICTPREPDCPACPLRSACAAHAGGAPESFPARRARAARPTRHGHLWWIEHDAFVALVRRPSAGLLGGMLALPGSGWTEAPAPFAPPVAAAWRRVPGVVRHLFTHFELRLQTHAARLDGDALPEIGGAALLWTSRAQLAQAGLPTLYRKAVQMMTDAEFAVRAGC